jgi:hypothetical protein
MKEYYKLLLRMAIKRGKNPTQAKKPRSNFGNESTSRRDDKETRKKSFTCRRGLKTGGLLFTIALPTLKAFQ